jgi:tRNA nucleotidyltransferase (CCA-adding enzyme)
MSINNYAPNEGVTYYKVGGCVRDDLLGIPSKDIDYAVEANSYNELRDDLIDRGAKIFQERPEYLTIRAQVPDIGNADFVICRKDGSYTDGRRPDNVTMGTLLHDLERRDFTMNAIAQTKDGSLIDPHGGRRDAELGFIRCVGCTTHRFSEDALRMLRAIRFSVTKDMTMSPCIVDCLEDPEYVDLLSNVSIERQREEFYKAFQHNTFKTLKALQMFPLIAKAVFGSKFSQGDFPNPDVCEIKLVPTITHIKGKEVNNDEE